MSHVMTTGVAKRFATWLDRAGNNTADAAWPTLALNAKTTYFHNEHSVQRPVIPSVQVPAHGIVPTPVHTTTFPLCLVFFLAMLCQIVDC